MAKSYKIFFLVVSLLLPGTSVFSREIKYEKLEFYLDCSHKNSKSPELYSYFPTTKALKKLGAGDSLCVDLSRPMIEGGEIAEFTDVTIDHKERLEFSSRGRVCKRAYQIRLNASGAEKMQEMTRGRRGGRMIVVEGGLAVSAPVFVAEIENGMFFFDVSSLDGCGLE